MCDPFRYQSTAILALQEASEDFLVRMFAQVNEIAIVGKQVTIQEKHILLWKRLFEYSMINKKLFFYDLLVIHHVSINYTIINILYVFC